MNDLELPMESKSILARIWQRTPLVVKAILVGFSVSSLGVGIWILNISFIPAPWSIVLMGIVLWAYLKYFSGSWWPKSTTSVRTFSFRNTNLSKSMWKWGLISAVLFVIVFQSGMVVTFRFIEYPAEVFKSEYSFDSMPVWLAWIGLIMASLVAGICEETGFRGYMQAPLEKKYGPKMAIAIVSFVFVVVHLHQAWAWPILFQVFAASVFMGILAYRTSSLIPGIVAHTILDIFNFSYWWSDVLGEFEEKPISETGIDQHFILWTVVFTMSIFLFFWSTGKARNFKVSVRT